MAQYNILIVDDEEAQREALAGYLVKKKHTIFTAPSGKHAIEIVSKETIDLILTDLRMPEMDGLSLLYKTRDINPDIDVIVMTAFGSIESATEAMKQGAFDFITKPVDLEQLDITIAKSFERKTTCFGKQTVEEFG